MFRSKGMLGSVCLKCSGSWWAPASECKWAFEARLFIATSALRQRQHAFHTMAGCQV